MGSILKIITLNEIKLIKIFLYLKKQVWSESEYYLSTIKLQILQLIVLFLLLLIGIHTQLIMVNLAI